MRGCATTFEALGKGRRHRDGIADGTFDAVDFGLDACLASSMVGTKSMLSARITTIERVRTQLQNAFLAPRVMKPVSFLLGIGLIYRVFPVRSLKV